VPVIERLPVKVRVELGAVKVPAGIFNDDEEIAFAPELNVPELMVIPPDPTLIDWPNVTVFVLLDVKLSSWGLPVDGISRPVGFMAVAPE